MSRSSITRITVFLLALTLPVAAFAGNIGKPSGGGSYMEWQVNGSNYDRVQLTVLDEAGGSYVRSFAAGSNPQFSLSDLGITDDGQYTYELRMFPKIASGVQKQLDKARAEGDDEKIKRLTKQYGLGKTPTQYGVITVLNGSIVSPDGVEADANDEVVASAAARFGAATTDGLRPKEVKVNDQVIPDKLIVQESTCTGFDCVSGESFGADTLRLKENNLRIHFEDTSTSAGYPANDWRLIANDQSSGGANYFAIEDSTAARQPFLGEAGAPASALYVDSSGHIGISQSAPGLDGHMTTGDTPGVRLEQTNAGGFTAQTWDIGGNEANFFIRDLTGGSKLSFRIRPGAPTSSIDISADGDVGFGQASPNANTRLDVYDTTAVKARIALTGTEFYNSANTSTDGIGLILGTNRTANRQLWIGDTSALTQNSTNRVIRFYPNAGDISAIATDGTTLKPLLLNSSGGNVGIATTAPAHPLQVGDAGAGDGNGAHVTTGGAWTSGSSRAFKENIEELGVDEALAAVASLKPVRYNYIKEKDETYVGFIAEDVPELVAQTSTGRHYLSPMDIVATLTKVVQEQQKTIEQLTKKVDELAKDKQ